MKLLIIALDGCDLEIAKKLNCKNILQKRYGYVNNDVGVPELPSTLIWYAFLKGELYPANKYNPKIFYDLLSSKIEDTIFDEYNSVVIDFPCYGSTDVFKGEIRRALSSEEEKTKFILKRLRKFHEKFERTKSALKSRKDADIIAVHFYLLDLMQHIYKDASTFYTFVDRCLPALFNIADDRLILIVSDHGFKDRMHHGYGFWSLNRDIDLGFPHFKDFRSIIRRLLK